MDPPGCARSGDLEEPIRDGSRAAATHSRPASRNCGVKYFRIIVPEIFENGRMARGTAYGRRGVLDNGVSSPPYVSSHPISSGSLGTKNPGYATCTQAERAYCH